MLILALVGLNVTAIAVWSAVNNRNGFSEAVKLFRGQPAFLRNDGSQ